MNTTCICHGRSNIRGFTLVELLVALSIGLFLLAGVFAAYINGWQSSKVVDDQVVMVDNARFALETLGADLEQAGVFGRVLGKADENGIVNISNTAASASVVSECVADWALDVENPLMVFDDASALPYSAPCINNYLAGDVLEVRGSLRDAVADANLATDRFYINSDVNSAEFFYGNTSPAISKEARNYEYYAYTYYVAGASDTAADGLPSLHRVSLSSGGVVNDELLLSGVADLQIQLGMDSDNDNLVDSYVNADANTNWGQVRSVQVTLTIVSANDNYTGANTQGGRRQTVVSKVTALRNINI